MKNKRTSRCKEYDHPEFLLTYDSTILDEWVDWFLNYLEEAVADGSVFKADETIQVGWMIARFKEQQGELLVEEPDFKSMPINWVNSVSNTLKHLNIMKYAAESVGMDDAMTFPQITDTGIVCTEFESSEGFFLSRSEPSENNEIDSGWFFGCVSEDHDHNSREALELASLYECATIKPGVVPYLALPIGTTIIDIPDPREIIVTFNDEELEIPDESYLGEQLKLQLR